MNCTVTLKLIGHICNQIMILSCKHASRKECQNLAFLTIGIRKSRKEHKFVSMDFL